ncbi:MAG: hypothetical protein ACJ740_02500, partial [Gaiellales bacterium]
FPGHGIVADLTKADEMRRAVAEAGEFDLAVNAVSPKGRFGGGDLTTTDDDALSPYLEQLLPEVFAFFRVCGGSLAERGGGTLIQVTGGSARTRAAPAGALGGRRRRRAGAVAGRRERAQAAQRPRRAAGLRRLVRRG